MPIYVQPFTSYSEILVGNCNFFLPPLQLTLQLWCSYWNSGKKFGPQKTRITGLPGSDTVWRYRLSSFDTIPACDGRTDIQPIAITWCAVWLAAHVTNRWAVESPWSHSVHVLTDYNSGYTLPQLRVINVDRSTITLYSRTKRMRNS